MPFFATSLIGTDPNDLQNPSARRRRSNRIHQQRRAADAVMAPEPEPVEYVRVCDAYGAGFFYIPGTETCLQISGYVWYQIGASSKQGPSRHPDLQRVCRRRLGQECPRPR
jgi:hypothetical protein